MHLSVRLVVCASALLLVSRSHAQDIKPYQAQTINADSSRTVRPHKADTVQPYKAEEVQQYKAQEIQPYRAKTIESGNASRDTAQKARAESKPVQYFFGVWNTRVPGAVWQTPSEVSGYDKLHVSTGASGGALRINKNHTYSWDSYGGKSGHWINGDAEYPIILIDKAEHKQWRVGYDPNHLGRRDIIIWDGTLWYDGRR